MPRNIEIWGKLSQSPPRTAKYILEVMLVSEGVPFTSCYDEVLDNRVVAADSVATATVVQKLVVLVQVEHVVDRIVKASERHLIRVVVSSCFNEGS